VLLLDLDGALGYWDLQRELYIMRHRALDWLLSLSHEFNLVAFSRQPKHLIRRVVLSMQRVAVLTNPGKYPAQYAIKTLLFDAVYRLVAEGRADSHHLGHDFFRNYRLDSVESDFTQMLLDFCLLHESKPPDSAEEAMICSFGEAVSPLERVVVLTPNGCSPCNVCYSCNYPAHFQLCQPCNPALQPLVAQLRCIEPVVVCLPHFRLNPKLSFDLVGSLLFGLQLG
jgi:hypothetical protein